MSIWFTIFLISTQNYKNLFHIFFQKYDSTFFLLEQTYGPYLKYSQKLIFQMLVMFSKEYLKNCWCWSYFITYKMFWINTLESKPTLNLSALYFVHFYLVKPQTALHFIVIIIKSTLSLSLTPATWACLSINVFIGNLALCKCFYFKDDYSFLWTLKMSWDNLCMRLYGTNNKELDIQDMSRVSSNQFVLYWLLLWLEICILSLL